MVVASEPEGGGREFLQKAAVMSLALGFAY